jgi:hypothetical protein
MMARRTLSAWLPHRLQPYHTHLCALRRAFSFPWGTPSA